MVDSNQTKTIIPRNVKGFKMPIERHRLTDWIEKHKQLLAVYIRHTLNIEK